jgi:CheY-like chemotaxis protein
MILFIDDDEIQNLINTKVASLVKPDLKVKSLTSAEIALEMLDGNTEKPLLIFLDINMPKMNGWDFLDAYMLQNGDVTVYMLSSSINQMDIERANSYEIVKDFICKPLMIDTFRHILTENNIL